MIPSGTHRDASDCSLPAGGLGDRNHGSRHPSESGDVRPVYAWLLGLVAGLVVYGISMAPGLLWGDSGEAQLQLILPGWYVNDEIARSHPLYYALASTALFLLPISAALAANLVSVVMGAVTIANIAAIVARLVHSRLAVFAATATLLFSHTLWQLSASAEVVSTTTALLSAELLFVLTLCQTGRLRYLALTALMNGLGVSNHNFALLIWPVYVLVALRFWSAWRPRAARALPLAGACLLLGMAPILAMCIDDLRTHRSLAHTLESFLVGHYGSYVFNVGRLPVLLARTVGYVLLNFPTPLILLVIWPGLSRAKRIEPRPFRWVFIAALAVHLLFAIRYDVPDQHTFLVPTWLFVALLIGIGADQLVKRRNTPALRRAVAMSALLSPLAYLAVPAVLRSTAPDLDLLPTREVLYRDRWTWFLQPWRTGYDGAERFALDTFELLPENAWLVLDATVCPPLNYLQVAENLRRDVRLDSWLAEQHWLPSDEKSLERGRQAALLEGRLFTTSIERRYTPPWLLDLPVRFEPTGHLYRAVPTDDVIPENATDE